MPALTSRAALSALVNLAIIFSLGFALGAVRTLWLAPRIGAASAVMVEQLPMLTASWFAARRIVHARALSRGECAVMGALSFALLMALECCLAIVLGGSARGWLTSLATLAGVLGLAGQAVFGAMPLAVWRKN
jgi:hypothetical protein